MSNVKKIANTLSNLHIVPKPNQLHVAVIFQFFFIDSRYVLVESSIMCGNSPESLERQSVVSQTQAVHL